jgi:hypothetical protein
MWDKLKYINNTMDSLLEEQKSLCPSSEEYKRNKEQQKKLFNQLIDSAGGGSSLDFVGNPQA